MDYDKLFAIGFLFAFGAIIIGGVIWCSVLYYFNYCNKYGHTYKLVGDLDRTETFKPEPEQDIKGYKMEKNYAVFRCEKCGKVEIFSVSSSNIDL